MSTRSRARSTRNGVDEGGDADDDDDDDARATLPTTREEAMRARTRGGGWDAGDSAEIEAARARDEVAPGSREGRCGERSEVSER